MLALGLLLNVAGVGLFCWLMFTLAAYALPFFVGLYAFMLALHGDAGVLGAPIAGIAAAGVTLAIGRMAFAITHSIILRAVIAALFAVPAMLAGHQVVFVMSQNGVPSLLWREIFACIGAVLIGGTAWTRLTVFADAHPINSNGAIESDPQPVLAGAAQKQ
jgi:hypothetical protein